MTKEPDKKNFNFTLTKLTLIVGLSLTVIAVAVTYFLSDYYELKIYFRDYIALFTTGVVCTTLFYHSENIILTHRYHQEKLDFEKEKLKNENSRKIAEYSLMICSEWFKPSLGESANRARALLKEYATKKNGSTAAELIQKIDENAEDRKAVITMLNYFEHISLLIKNGLVDEFIMEEAFRTVFCDYYRVLKPYIDERQTLSRRIFINYEEIAQKWSKN